MSIPDIVGLLCLLCVVLLLTWASARWLFGGILRLTWRALHGAERSGRFRWGVLGLLASGFVYSLACLPLFLSSLQGPERASFLQVLPFMLLVGVLGEVGTFLGVWQALKPIGQDAAPVTPASVLRDHDGLELELTSRRAWVSGSIVLLSMLVAPLNLLLVVPISWLIKPRVRVRLRSSVVEAEGVTLPLAGLAVSRGERWDGTPTVTLEAADHEPLVLCVGGHDPGEVAWWVAQLEQAAGRACALTPVASPPEALRQLVRHGHGTRAPDDQPVPHAYKNSCQ